VKTPRSVFPLAAVLGVAAVLTAAGPADAQFGVNPRVGFTYQFGIQPNASYNPFAPFLPTLPGRFTFRGYTLSGVGGTVSYGYYRSAAAVAPTYLFGYNGVDEYAPLSGGFGGGGKVAAQQRTAIANAQRNAKWDKGATDTTPDFDRWLKDAAARRETPDPKAAKGPAVDAALVDPPEEAILSGDALNQLAARVRELEKQGKKANAGLLAPELTTKIVFTGGAAADAANLYRDPTLRFPATFKSDTYAELRTDLEKAFAPVAREVHAGKRSPAADVDKLLKAVERGQQTTRQVVADATFGDACEVSEFFTGLESATKYLKDDKSVGVAGAEWSALGATVAEVVRHQAKYGLRFGPVKAGDEAAYFSLHRGLLAYYAGLLQAK
jgi:hypothetical protein